MNFKELLYIQWTEVVGDMGHYVTTAQREDPEEDVDENCFISFK